MTSRESFLGTIALGVAALLIMAAGAYWLAAPLAFKAVALTALLAYLTQAATTAQIWAEQQSIDRQVAAQAGYSTIGDPYAAARQVLLMHRVAVLLWLLTVIAGGLAMLMLLLGK